MLVGCVGLYGERVDQSIPCIERLRPHIDRYVVIADETVNEEQKTRLRALGCEVHVHPWKDSMVEMRNQYLEKIAVNDWAIVHDPDEHFNEEFCKDVRKIIGEAEAKQVTLLLINSHDISHDSDGNTRTSVSDFFKNLIFKKTSGTRYYGIGQVQEVHEMLSIPGVKEERLDRKYWYTHEKHYYEVWERAGRNVFIAGGGNNRGMQNPSWRPLRDLCDGLGIKNWFQAREYFRKGNVDPGLKQWFWDNRFEGYDYEHEMMEFGRWYFEYLHPEEAAFPDGRVWKLEQSKPDRKKKDAESVAIMSYIESIYLEVLGRHADQEGKEVYTGHVLAGRLKREDLPKILRESKEYKEKIGRCQS